MTETRFVPVIQNELQDPFWQTRHTRKFGFGRSGRSDNGLGKLAGYKDNEFLAETLPLNWAFVDECGHVSARLPLSKDLGRLVLGPGPSYQTGGAFEKTGRFAAGAQVSVKGREAWAETEKERMERSRPKTPTNLISLGSTAPASENPVPGKFYRKVKPTISLKVKETNLPGPGEYDSNRPFQSYMISTVERGGRTRIVPQTKSLYKRKSLGKSHFTEAPSYNLSLELGKGAPSVFMTTEERGKEQGGQSKSKVGPGSYEVISPLKHVASPSPKAKWFAKYAFSTDAESAVPFKNTRRY